MSGGEMARAEGLPEGAAPGVGVDLYAQARKALSLRTPFEGEGPAPRVPTLPARLVNWSGPSDARKKHKKIQPEDLADVEHPPQPVTEPSAKAGAWEHFEAYFRPVNLDDIDMLMPKFPFRYGELDSCILIPFVGSRKELDVGSGKELDQLMDTSETFDVAVAETSSYLGLGGEERVSNKEHSERNEQSVEQGIHEVVVRQFVSNKERSEQSVEQGIHEVAVQQENWPLEVEQTTGSAGIVSPECENEEQSSLNWLLGAKERFVLTSERPNKKRKLLGVDAGLEQLVLLPPPGDEASSICDVCCLGDSGAVSNSMLNCDSCKVRVHQKCYGLHVVPDGQWLCTWCKDLESAVQLLKKDADSTSSMPCVLCPKEKGALKPVKGETTQTIHGGNPKFVHLFCSLWIPGALVEDMESMEPVTNVGSVQENQRKVVCSICKVKHGVCVRCSHGTCRAAFHPICARESKHQMEIWGKFGHPKVELRAFCSKHSAIGCINSVERSASQQSPTEVRANDASLITGKIPKLRFTRKNKDKSMNCKTTSLSSSNLIKVDTVEQTSLPHTVRSSDSLATQGMEVETDNLLVGGNLMSNSADIAVVLRKLIDQGKVSVGEIASEVGISSESLEAALVGETTTFSHGLKLKIIKWLQNSAHIPVARANTSKGGSIVVHDSKPGGIEDTDSGNMKSSFVPDGKKGAAVDFSDSAVMKSPSTRSKDNSKIMGDIKSICATGVTLLQNGIKKMAETGTDHDCSLAEDCAKKYTQNFCPVGGKDTPKEEHEELIPNSISGNTQLGTSMEIPNQNKVTSPGKIRDNLTEAEPGSEREGVSSLNQCFSSGDNVKHGLNSVENGVGNNHDFNTDHMPGQPFSNFDDSHYYIHPFIKEKMGQLWDNTFKQNRLAPCHRDPLCSPDEKKPVDSLIKLTETTSVIDQVSEAKSLDILEHSPDDEVEGELLYLQARLLDTAAVLKDRYEDLIAKVVQNLSRELDAFSKRKWDFIFVNQFLRDVREAKKRGRKEKRNKEAQAILAAAAAAVAASSRNSTVRKDATDDTVSANQQSSPKFSAGPPRAGQQTSSLLRLKDLSKPSNNKVSQDTNCSMFHMPICSKENALYCDVCMRSETVLNRIFVCSRCKAAVHIDCYGNFENSIGPWKCELCKDISAEAACVGEQPDRNGTNLSSVHCDLCHGISGAFRKTADGADGQWIHAFCAEWLLENKYVRGQDNPVNGMDSLVKDRDTCCVCLGTVGACLKCNSGDCQSTFHPSCAKNAGFYMNTKGFGGMLQHKAYCNKHSIEQKEADMQQYGPEEFNNMKRMRVELEKLRLLCERIIKREKVKRERVLCDHDILAKTKDTLVFSCLAHGASSESATTSVNNKSYSGTMQRSDDVTVDSTISGKKVMRFSLNNRDAEINTADSSRTLISFKRKFSERGSLAGKQLPQRSVASLQKSEAGEKNTKDKKHRETFQKELVMTSDQASTQNQRLPKGYAYVPRDSLKRSRGTETHRPMNHKSLVDRSS